MSHLTECDFQLKCEGEIMGHPFSAITITPEVLSPQHKQVWADATGQESQYEIHCCAACMSEILNYVGERREEALDEELEDVEEETKKEDDPGKAKREAHEAVRKGEVDD